MTPAAGGHTIALVGADGSGKSTMTAELERWLGWKLQVSAYYLGSKSPSAASRGSYLAFRAFRRAHRSVTGSLGDGSIVARPIGWARDTTLAMHHLAIARDRSRRYREGRRDAQAGRVVIFDRMPLFALSDRPEHLVLDGPRIRGELDGTAGRLMRRLAAAEEARYRSLALPDHLVFLDVSPEVASSRKPDHLPEVLAAKSRAAAELATLAELAGATDVIRIDADRPLDVVLPDVQRRLWDVL